LNNEEIARCFSIDHDSKIMLGTQFKQCLSTFIKNSAAGTRIPPERKISDILKLARGTIRNAMQEFFDNDQIVRNGRRGTFVAEKKPDQVFQNIHPMALGLSTIDVTCNLKLLLHENIPYQKKFWNKVVTGFNNSQQLARVEIDWLPNHIHEHNIEKYLQENQFDIVQVQVKQSMLSLGHTVPGELQNKLKSEAFQLELYNGDTDMMLSRIVPIHQSRHLVFWNDDLAQKIGLKNIRSRLRNGNMFELFAEAADKLPEDMFASGHVWDIPAMQGIPHNLSNDEIEQEVLAKFSSFMPYAGRERMFMTSHQGAFGDVRNFIEGKQLFLNQLPNHLFLYDMQTDFAIKTELFPVAPGNIAYASAMGLCAAKNAINPNLAFEFIEYVLSDEIQQLAAKDKLNMPYRRSALNSFAKAAGVEPEVLNKSNNCIRVEFEKDTVLVKYFQMMVHFSREELYDILHGKRDAHECTASFMNKWYNSQYRVKKQEGTI
jgi:DNA-binding transcriptional regulator YhcF (GntR family)